MLQLIGFATWICMGGPSSRGRNRTNLWAAIAGKGLSVPASGALLGRRWQRPPQIRLGYHHAGEPRDDRICDIRRHVVDSGDRLGFTRGDALVGLDQLRGNLGFVTAAFPIELAQKLLPHAVGDGGRVGLGLGNCALVIGKSALRVAFQLLGAVQERD